MARYELELDQLVVMTVFLYDDLDEEIFMTQLIGFKTTEKRIWCAS